MKIKHDLAIIWARIAALPSFPIILAGIMAISVFLPWIKLSLERIPYPDLYWDGSGSVFVGTELTSGIFGLLVALGGGFMAYKKHKWTAAAGVINLWIGIAQISGWISFQAGPMVNVSSHIGLYLFTIVAFLFTNITMKWSDEGKRREAIKTRVNQKAKQVEKE